MEKQVEIITTIHFNYDPNSIEFRISFKNYKNNVNAITKDDMLQDIAKHIGKYGTDTLIESIGGYISVNGQMPIDNWSGINVTTQQYDAINCKLNFDSRLMDNKP